MRTIIETDVIVIGGGVTGAGVLRDLALRGIKGLLVEQKDLGYGTSSRNHGLLHSGARYAVKDEEAAIESYKENLILKHTIPGSIEKTGGFFVKVPNDPNDYVEQWLHSCRKVGIPVEEIPIHTALQQEPSLRNDIEAVYHVPDGSVDVFTLVIDVVADAVKRGASVLRYHEVVSILRNGTRVYGVIVRDVYTKEEKEIRASIIVNAAGPWGAQVAEMAEVPLTLINNKGMLTIFGHRFNKRVINRLRNPGDADIFVPAHNVTIFGTTGMNVEDPNDFSLHSNELEMMILQGEEMIPRLREMRMIRAFCGSRPLYQEVTAGDQSGRNITRGIALLDHEVRDGLEGLITITGGKLTTFRFMAEKTVDLICKKLNHHAICTSHEEIIQNRHVENFLPNTNIAPAAKTKLAHWSGNRLEKVERKVQEEEPTVVCECEQVTWTEIETTLESNGRFHIGDIRRRTRLGMGPCQGTFCNHRVAALAVEKGLTSVEDANWALQQALGERKKGMHVVATNETAKQVAMMECIYYVTLGMKEEDESLCTM